MEISQRIGIALSLFISAGGLTCKLCGPSVKAKRRTFCVVVVAEDKENRELGQQDQVQAS